MEKRKEFCGVAVDKNQGCISISHLKEGLNLLREVTECLTDCGSSIDYIRQINKSESNFYGNIQVCFRYTDKEYVIAAISSLRQKYSDLAVSTELDLHKVTLVGTDCRGNAQAAIRVISTLEANEIEVKSIHSGDLAISCLVESSPAQQAARLIHEEFQLSTDFCSTRIEELSLIA